MKYNKLLLITTSLLIASCANSGEEASEGTVTEQKATASTSKKQTTKQTTSHSPASSSPIWSVPDPIASPIVASSTTKEDVELFEQKQSPYGTLKDADAPPTEAELTASPEPASLPAETIITPPSGP